MNIFISVRRLARTMFNRGKGEAYSNITSFMFACKNGYLDMVNIMLEVGVDPHHNALKASCSIRVQMTHLVYFIERIEYPRPIHYAVTQKIEHLGVYLIIII